jgi:hypothetical protein
MQLFGEAVDLHYKCQQRHQTNQASNERVYEKLTCRIPSFRPTPDTDKEKHWKQRKLEEQIEEE